ncbi:MAG: bacillithiol biosynthesis cysteine-adding enzyme BshC [Bacteroidia bacterium]
MSTTKSIRTDYLNAADPLKPFYQYPVNQPDFAKIVADKGREDIDRAGLQQVIKEQYEGLVLSEASQRHLDLLAKENTFTITTGHQLVLMGGPMFTTYKVLTAIKLAEQLSAQDADHHFVPIFWIHTEDHDYEEINHYYSSFQQKQTYQGQFQSMVGEHVLTEQIEEVLPDHFAEHLRRTYRPGRKMSEAFRDYINELFGEYGVLMLDADDPRLKTRFSTVLKQEVKENAAFSAVNATSEALTEAGYPAQIHAREINLFFLDKLGRNRIVGVNGHYEAIDRDFSWSQDELDKMIENHPEQFSPNVSLRPLYQEMILPNLCYIGGWGELSYWLQLKGVFAHFGVNFPLLLPRMSATIVPRSVKDKWEAKKLKTDDFRTSSHEVYRKFMPQVWEESNFLNQSTEILQQIDQLKDIIEGELSPTLARSGEALKVKTARYLKSLEKKAHRVMRHKHPQEFDEIKALKYQVQPDGLVQERILSLASFPGVEPQTLIKLAWEHCDPLNLEHVYLDLAD